MTSKSILVIGAGSIGERHVHQLLQLGMQDIYLFRKRNLPLRTLSTEQCKVINNWNEVDELCPFAAVVCSPTSLHFDQMKACIERGIHTLVEKPISNKLESTEEIAESINLLQKDTHVQVGYMLRYHPFVKYVKEAIDKNTFGRLFHIHSYWGEYLPNWHPWEDYRESYAAKKELGGGAALTLSHDIDLACFFMDETPAYYKGALQTNSPLTVDVDSAFDLILQSSKGIQANIHVNFYDRNSSRNYRFVFEKATINYDYFDQKMTINNGKDCQTISFHDFKRDDLFLAQMKDFLAQCMQPDNAVSLKNIQWALSILNYCFDRH